MAKNRTSLLAKVAAGLSGIFASKPKRESINSLSGDTKKFHGREPFTPWWLYLKGAQSRHLPGQQEIPQWRWPDKDQYGQAKDGSIRHATFQTPFRVRRWRKRAAAKIAKQGGHTIQYAKEIVKNIEAGAIRDQIKKLDNEKQLAHANQATA